MAEAIPTSVLFDYIDKTAKTFGVDPGFAKEILLAENVGKDGVVPSTIPTDRISEKNARGLMQVIPATHEGLTKQGYLPTGHTLDTWQSQLDAGMAAIGAKQKEHGTTDPRIIAAAYNGGNAAAKNVRAGNLTALPQETWDYLQKVDNANRLLTGGSSRLASSQGDIRKSERADGGATDLTTPSAAVPAPLTGADAILRTVENNGLLFESLISDITKSTEAATAAKTSEAESLAAAGAAAGTEAMASGVIDAANVQMRERILGILGLDTRTVDNVVSRNMADQIELQGQRKVLAKTIDERMSVGFFDNPLQWLINQTILPGEVASHNSIARRERDNIDEISSLQAAATAQERIDISASVDDIAKRSTALATMRVAEANAKAQAAKAQSAALSAHAAMQIGSLRGRQADDQVRVLQWKEVLNDRRDAAQKKQEDRDKEVELDTKLRTFGASIGRPDLSLTALRKTTSKKTQEAIVSQAVAGNFGDSFTEAVTFISQYGNLQGMRSTGKAEFADLQAAFQTKIINRAREIETTWATLYPGVKAQTMEQNWKQAADELGAKFQAEVTTNMVRADPANPYLVSHAKEVMTYKGDPNNLIYRAAKDAYTNNQQVTDKIILDYMDNLISDKKITPAQAAQQFKEYYSDAVMRNNRDRSISLMGLAPQTGYSVKIEGIPQPVNLLNPVQVENRLTNKYASKFRETIGEIGFGGFMSMETARQIQEGKPAKRPYKFGQSVEATP